MQKELVVFSFFSVFCLIGALALYSVPEDLARLGLVFLFWGPVLWTVSLAIRHKYYDAQIAEGITCFVTPVFAFFVENITRFMPFLDGVEFSETRMLVQQYSQTGRIDFSAIPHSPYFQTPWLMYAISSITGLPLLITEICFLVFCFLFLGAISVCILRVISNRLGDRTSFLPFLMTFSLVGASSLMFTNIDYRYLGAFILPLLIISFLDKRITSKAQSCFVFLFLTIGITLGDPVSSLLMIPIFVFYSLLKRDSSLSVYAIIPASYSLYNAGEYISLLKAYFDYAWNGAITFIKGMIAGHFPERILPWNRLLTVTQEDSYVASAAYISLLILILIICTHYLVNSWSRLKGKKEIRKKDDPLIVAVTIFLFPVLSAVLLIYIGASVQPEISFSDSRTILLGYCGVPLLFSMASKAFLSKLGRSRFFFLIVTLLLLAASLRVIYQAFPKSFQDPISTVEDKRLGLKAMGFAGSYFMSYYQNGSILLDYKTNNYVDLRFTIKSSDEHSMMSDTTTDFNTDFLMFDLNGLKYPSSFVPSDVYAKAYKTGLTENLIYNNGAIVIFEKP